MGGEGGLEPVFFFFCVSLIQKHSFSGVDIPFRTAICEYWVRLSLNIFHVLKSVIMCFIGVFVLFVIYLLKAYNLVISHQ